MKSRWILGLSGACLLAACAAKPTPQDLAVTGDTDPSPPGTMFRSNDPKINDVLAKGYCADGYQKLDESIQPSDGGTWTEWHIRCTPYEVSLLPF